MTSPFRRLVRRWLWLEAGSVSLSVAALGSMFIIASAARDEAPIIQTAYAGRVLPLAPVATNDAQDERLPAPIGGARADESGSDPRPPTQDAGEHEVVVSHAVPSSAPTPDPEMDEVNQYLWAVYE